MNIPFAALALLCVTGSIPGYAQITTAPHADQTTTNVAPPSQEDTPAQQRINAAKRQITADPKKIKAFNDLAIADLRRARETANPAFENDAEQALKQGFAIDENDFQLQKTQVSLLLARHQYAAAREKAATLNRRTPDDVMVYGYLAEADIALGDYPEAEKSTQWMLNMLPNNVPGLLLGAKLRTLYGDPDGALELLNMAYREVSPTEVEDLAWIANQTASIQLESGKPEAAAAALEQAEPLFPHYPYTLENLARVRLAQRRPADAVTLLLQARQLDYQPTVLYQLAEAESAAGQPTQAQATYAEFQKAATTASNVSSEATRDLILLYSKAPETAPKALTLAQHEIAARHDVWTLDAASWALHSNSRSQEADAQIQKALAVGIQNAQIFNHAGHIAQTLNRTGDAAKFFELSIRTNPASEYAADSRRSLGLPDDQSPLPTGSSLANSAPAPTSTKPASLTPVGQGSDSAVPPINSTQTISASTLPPVPSALLTPRPTDTDRVIHSAQASVTRTPKDPAAYAGLGAAYFQRARETGDVNDYQLAEQALTRSLDLVSSDFSSAAALRTMAEVCMGEHRFAEALTYAQKALALGSGDLSPFAIIGDADADMGEYDEAASDYARLDATGADLAPRDAYARDSRLAYLRFITGDTAAAIRLMRSAVAEGTEAQLPSENLSWLFYELGEFYTQAGDVAAADAAYRSALTTHPGDYRALAGLGKLRGNQGRYAEAIVFYQKAIAVVPMPIFVAELGDLYTKAGNPAEAKKQYQLVEYIGLLGHINQVLHNRDLAIFYADHDIKLAEALELANKELEVRHDVYTWDALAWALYKNGKFTEADRASQKALKFGTRDSLLLFHAGMIAGRLGQRDQARNRLKEALTINPHFHAIYADQAQQQLTSLEMQTEPNPTVASHAQ